MKLTNSSPQNFQTGPHFKTNRDLSLPPMGGRWAKKPAHRLCNGWTVYCANHNFVPWTFGPCTPSTAEKLGLSWAPDP